MNPQCWSPPGEWERLGLGKEVLVWFGDVAMSPKCPGTKFQLESEVPSWFLFLGSSEQAGAAVPGRGAGIRSRWEVIWDEAQKWSAPSKSCCWISSLSFQGSDHPGGNIPAVLELLKLPLLLQRRRHLRPESKCRSTASLSLPSSRSWDLGWPLDSRPLWPPRSKG